MVVYVVIRPLSVNHLPHRINHYCYGLSGYYAYAFVPQCKDRQHKQVSKRGSAPVAGNCDGKIMYRFSIGFRRASGSGVAKMSTMDDPYKRHRTCHSPSEKC